MKKRSARDWIRPLVQELQPYVPGEQPKIKGLVKLNTNENPYPPSPKVLKAVRTAVDQRLRLYPNPTAQPLREKLADFHQIDPKSVIIGNGSDELLALAIRAFVQPAPTRPAVRSMVQFFTPCYSLYRTLTEIHGARSHPVPLASDFALPSKTVLRKSPLWKPDAALTLVTTPNAPTGRGYSVKELEALCLEHAGLVLLDEAYVGFAREHAMSLAAKHPHVLVARTFSKGYSLCFQRVGYLVGNPELIAALDKIRDSYNVNGLGQVAGVATLEDHPYYEKNFKRVIRTRDLLAKKLAHFGFKVWPSDANFLLVEPPHFSAAEWLQRLRERKILVRWFSQPEVSRYLRISIGTEEEVGKLLQAVEAEIKRR